MLVYSVVSRKTFDILEDMRRKIDDSKKGTNIPLVVVGNKCDLAHMRQVTRDEGENIGICLMLISITFAYTYVGLN